MAGVAKAYPPRNGAPRVPVLRGVSFSVGAGDAVALLGPNGAGKSTLLYCCNRLVEPDTGRIEILGRDITGLSRRQLRATRARIGFIFQRHNLVPRLTALTNVLHGAQGQAAGAWFQAVAPTGLRQRALHCLDLVGLADFATKRADELSGGQSQRVAVARALMQEPAVILADEPAASLDPRSGEEVMELLHDLTLSHGITRLFTTHNLRHAVDYADRILALGDGAIVLDQPASELATAELRTLYG